MKKYYLYIIACYAVIMLLAMNNGKSSHPEEEVAQPLQQAVATDTIGLDFALLVPEAPSLKASNITGLDTMASAPKRYPKSMTDSTYIPINMLLRTDGIDEMIFRFNADSSSLAEFEGKVDFTAAGTLSQREGVIYALTNEAYPQTNATLKEFVTQVVKDSLFIDYENGTNWAIMNTFSYEDLKGEIFPVRLTFQKGRAANEVPVWFIRSAESPYFTYGDKNKPWFIDNAEPEFEFSGLMKFPNRSAESLTGQQDYKGDGLAAYLLLQSKGLIKFVNPIQTWVIFRTGHWQGVIERVESYEHNRSGWLITRLAKNGTIVFQNIPQ